MVLRIFKMIATMQWLSDSFRVHQNAFSAVAQPGTPLGEFTALPTPPNWFKGPTSKGSGGRERGKQKRRGEK